MKWLNDCLKVLNSFLEGILTFFFFIMVALVILLVFLRYVFKTTIIGGNELVVFLFIYTTALGAFTGFVKNTHINIPVVFDHFPAKARKYVDIFNHFMILILNGVIVILGFSWIKSVGGFDSPELHIPQGMIQVSVLIGCGLVILYCINHMIAGIRDLVSRKDK